MNTAIQCIILLACTAICNSASITKCHCLKTGKSVRLSLVADIKTYEPRPYCNKKEVIVILRGKDPQCLDPEGKFTKALLQTIKMQRAAMAAKVNASRTSTTTVPPTLSVTVETTSS